MAVAAEVSADDLKVFLQEADGLIELLDEDLVQLEQEAGNEELLQEIFRAAHTLKGSSGMLGFDDMAHLTHAMEDVLDRVRKGSLAISPELVDALLMSLDGLKVLKDNLGDGPETPIEIQPIVDALNAAADAGDPPDAAAVIASLHSVVAADEELQATIEAAVQNGTVFHLTVELDPATDWKAVRCFQVINALDECGEILVSSPSQADIEQEKVSARLEVLLATTQDAADVQAPVEQVEDVKTVSVLAWDPAAAVAAAAPPKEADNAEARSQVAGATGRVDALQTTVRIEVDQLDSLMNMVGELVIDRTRVSQLSRLLQQRFKEDEYVSALAETSTHIARVVDELHESMMEVRMLPVGLLFSKFPRLVRDLSRSLGRKVTLELEGEETEIDRSVIEKIKDPLVHMIRNSVDHGIEAAEDRAAAGKPEESILRLVASHEQGQIVISLYDDGRGIDSSKVIESAIKKGQLTQEAADRLSEREKLDLIFQPGLSTAAKTTEVSGRGVGMDIVRRDIESLNGRVEVETELGKGTTFRLRLPLTLATFRGLLVSSGGTTYAIPLTYVQETMRPEPAQLSTVSKRPVMSLRGSVMSLIFLDESLGIQQGVVSTRAEEPYVVVVRASDSDTDRPVAIAVDELVDQQEIVVKSLSGFLGRARGISGASILGDGQVVLILDVPSMIKHTQARDSEQPVGSGPQKIAAISPDVLETPDAERIAS
ncbi:MAG: chemotaxis protein CheA [Dehalococcoidia bacterium]|jgi:two-component system, chemotaxis family, sensor kinase CheA|nr:chemotaxis protein CheA [Dehalococcoidia bacterium]